MICFKGYAICTEFCACKKCFCRYVHRNFCAYKYKFHSWEAAVTQELRGELTVVDQVDDLRDEVADTLDILLQRQHDRVKLSAHPAT